MLPSTVTVDDFRRDLRNGKVIQDAVHGAISLHPLVAMIIDTKLFNRLRRIKCTAEACWVYPSCAHSRFEHSLGVYHLACTCVLELLESSGDVLRDSKIVVTYQDVLCVCLAGLLHDLGHGPWSHTFEAFLNDTLKKKKMYGDEEQTADKTEGISTKKKFHHEDMSVLMINELFDSKAYPKILQCAEAYGLELASGTEYNDMSFIKELINGPEHDEGPKEAGHDDETTTTTTMFEPFTSRPPSKFFLFEIVANKRTCIDIDRCDYFARDSQACGISVPFHHERLFKHGRIMWIRKDADAGVMADTTCIAYPVKDVGGVFELFSTRRLLHTKIYQHRVVKLTDEMLRDVLALYVKYFGVAAKDENGSMKIYTLANAHTNMHAFMLLDDTLLGEIQRGRNTGPTPTLTAGANLEAAQRLLDRIDERDLYHVIGRFTTRSDVEYIQAFPESQCGMQKSFFTEKTLYDGEDIGTSDKKPGSSENKTLEPSSSQDGPRKQLFKDMCRVINKRLKPVVDRELVEDVDIVPMTVTLGYGAARKLEHPLETVVFYQKNEPNKPVAFHKDMLLNSAAELAALVTVIDYIVIKPSLKNKLTGIKSSDVLEKLGEELTKMWKNWQNEPANTVTGKLYYFETPDVKLGSSVNKTPEPCSSQEITASQQQSTTTITPQAASRTESPAGNISPNGLKRYRSGDNNAVFNSPSFSSTTSSQDVVDSRGVGGMSQPTPESPQEKKARVENEALLKRFKDGAAGKRL